MEVAIFVCDRNGSHHFTRFTDMEQENRTSCFFKDCEGWMYPHQPQETKRWWEFWK